MVLPAWRAWWAEARLLEAGRFLTGGSTFSQVFHWPLSAQPLLQAHSAPLVSLGRQSSLVYLLPLVLRFNVSLPLVSKGGQQLVNTVILFKHIVSAFLLKRKSEAQLSPEVLPSLGKQRQLR